MVRCLCDDEIEGVCIIVLLINCYVSVIFSVIRRILFLNV